MVSQRKNPEFIQAFKDLMHESSKALENQNKKVTELFFESLDISLKFIESDISINLEKKVKKLNPPPEFYYQCLIVISRTRRFWDESKLSKEKVRVEKVRNLKTTLGQFLSELSSTDTSIYTKLLSENHYSKFPKDHISRHILDILYKGKALSDIAKINPQMDNSPKVNIESLIDKAIAPLGEIDIVQGYGIFNSLYPISVETSLKTLDEHDPFLFFTMRELLLLFNHYFSKPHSSNIAKMLNFRAGEEKFDYKNVSDQWNKLKKTISSK